jgi:hypothetical protein
VGEGKKAQQAKDALEPQSEVDENVS